MPILLLNICKHSKPKKYIYEIKSAQTKQKNLHLPYGKISKNGTLRMRTNAKMRYNNTYQLGDKNRKVNDFIKHELLLGRIQKLTQNNNDIWQCNICQREKTTSKAITGHMAVMRGETAPADLYRPYCNKKTNNTYLLTNASTRDQKLHPKHGQIL